MMSPRTFGLPLTLFLALSLWATSGQDAPPGGADHWKVPPSAAELRNPYAGTDNHRLAGRKLYQRYCSPCHGKEVEGVAGSPALATDRVRDAKEGRLFWYIKNGNSRAGMPAWSRLPDQQIWQLVTFLQMTPEK